MSLFLSAQHYSLEFWAARRQTDSSMYIEISIHITELCPSLKTQSYSALLVLPCKAEVLSSVLRALSKLSMEWLNGISGYLTAPMRFPFITTQWLSLCPSLEVTPSPGLYSTSKNARKGKILKMHSNKHTIPQGRKLIMGKRSTCIKTHGLHERVRWDTSR